MPLPATAWALAELNPAEWVHVADYLSGLLHRAPLAAGKGWAAERIVIGCLVSELRENAHDAGEPDVEPAAEPVSPALAARLAIVTPEPYEAAIDDAIARQAQLHHLDEFEHPVHSAPETDNWFA